MYDRVIAADNEIARLFTDGRSNISPYYRVSTNQTLEGAQSEMFAEGFRKYMQSQNMTVSQFARADDPLWQLTGSAKGAATMRRFYNKLVREFG
jgi:hypothetical protein